jgi:hypothetical protein
MRGTHLGASIPYHDELIEGGRYNIGAGDLQRMNMNGEVKFETVLLGKNLEAIEHGKEVQS